MGCPQAAEPLDYRDELARSGEKMSAELLQGQFPRRQYAKPPVVEAIARLHWDEPFAWNVTTPGLIFERVRHEYPLEPQFQNVMQADFAEPAGQDGPPNFHVTTGPQKIIFSNSDRTQLLIVGPNDVSTHSLAPYEGWESLERRLRVAVEMLGDFVRATGLSQVGIRYINRVEIPSSGYDFTDYMTIGFSMPEAWPGRITAFLDRAEYAYPDERSRIAFTWASTESEVGASAFIIDLDLLATVNEDERRAGGWGLLAELKARETAAFESLIQDKLREMFDEVK